MAKKQSAPVIPRPTASKARRKAQPKAPAAGRQPATARAPAAAVPVGGTAFPIVGFGASAGGLEAFTQVLTHLPARTGMAFVLVQHLDPKHESLLTGLLAKATRMPVLEVKDGVRVAPDHVYVIPPNTNLAILHGVLSLMPRGEGRAARTPVDFFLHSLACDQGTRAIGVILSGTASDGTLGLQAIKGEGGITFAQEAASAKYDGMPKSAIAGGGVDFILPPEGIARELARVGRHPYVALGIAPDADVLLPKSEDSLQKIFIMIRAATGVDFSHYKPPTIKRRILRRMMLHKLDKLDAYFKYLQDNPAEVNDLYNDILINVTHFFRDPEVYEALKNDVIPKILASRPPDVPVRVWVPGCASGEEAYSVAICLLEVLGTAAADVPLQIFASDLSTAAIDKGRAGIYPENIAEQVSAERLRRYFVKTEGGYRVSQPLRDMCLFARHDLTRNPSFSRIDLICCRNVLIYLDAVLQKRVLQMFHYALKPQGFLMLGTSESIGSHAELFSLADKKHRFYTRKDGGGRPDPGPVGAWFNERGSGALRESERHPAGSGLQEEVDRLILSRYAPAAIVVSESLDILQFRGNMGPYLAPAAGAASLSLTTMLRQPLLLDLRAAIRKAASDGLPVRRAGIVIQSSAQTRHVDVEVAPIKAADGGLEPSFLVLFADSVAPAVPPEASGEKPRRGKRKGEDPQLTQLRHELAVTKEYLQSIIEQQEASNEELRSANEEAQSTNEELQSINEELETAKEELQSANEELTTVNEELQNRNQELGQVNDDLNNLLSSVNIAIIMLSSDLRVRRFTPATERVLNLIASDVGRPVRDFKPPVGVPDLEQMAQEVMDTLIVREREITIHDGHKAVLRIRPYRTGDNRIDGVVITLVEAPM